MNPNGDGLDELQDGGGGGGGGSGGAFGPLGWVAAVGGFVALAVVVVVASGLYSEVVSGEREEYFMGD